MYRRFILGLALLAAGDVARAQIQIDKLRPARGAVSVSNEFGSVRVVGWERNEVRVTGTLAGGAEGLEFDGDEDGVQVDVRTPESWQYETDDDTEFRSDLVVQVPRGSQVSIETLNASTEVVDVDGAVEVETTNGRITVRGAPKRVEIESVTGAVEVEARGAPMEVETMSGDVKLSGVRGTVGVSTVSGAVGIAGEALSEVRVESVTGDIALDASLTKHGGIEIETHSGRVELRLPRDAEASFECETFSGAIENEFGAKPRREGRFKPFQKLRFSTELETNFEVRIETYNGPIALRARGGAAARPAERAK